MSKPSPQDIVRAVLDLYGTTFCRELAIAVEEGNNPSLFQLLCVSSLFTDRIDWVTTLGTARLLKKRGIIDTPQRLAASSYDELSQIFREAGYVLYNFDELMSRRLLKMAAGVFDRYNGDLNDLRRRAGNVPDKERNLMNEFEGMGDASVGFFCREIQGVWEEFYPFIDHKAMDAARELGLPDDSAELASLCSRRDFPRFASGLVRVGLKWDYERIFDKARQLQTAGV